MSDANSLWNATYAELVNRNLGLISKEDQWRLKHAKVCIFGMGGFGGVVFEILVRSGIEHFCIVDNDVFEATNLNRQIFAFQETLGQMKTETAVQWARNINADARVDIFDHVDEDNVEAILKDAHLAILAIDHFRSCLVVARKARQSGIPFVEGWALPFANVCTFTPDSASFEETYGLEEIKHRSSRDISEAEGRRLLLKLLFSFGDVEEAADYYRPETLVNLAKGIQPSFAPMVWLTATLMALESIKVLLRWGALSLSPHFSIYDPFQHRVPKRFNDLPPDKKRMIRQILEQSETT